MERTFGLARRQRFDAEGQRGIIRDLRRRRGDDDTILTTHRANVLIIARSSQVRKGLHALLRAIPGVHIVDVSCDQLLQTNLLAKCAPHLVLIDCNCWSQEVLDALTRFRLNYKDSKLLLLVEDIHQQQRVLSAGINNVLVKGTPAAQLVEAIDDILSSGRD